MDHDVNQMKALLSPNEQLIQKVWMSVLETNRIGLHEHFLDIGGDSLSAMLCVSRLRTQFGVEFALEDFFDDDATVFKFAHLLDENQKLAKPL